MLLLLFLMLLTLMMKMITILTVMKEKLTIEVFRVIRFHEESNSSAVFSAIRVRTCTMRARVYATRQLVRVPNVRRGASLIRFHGSAHRQKGDKRRPDDGTNCHHPKWCTHSRWQCRYESRQTSDSTASSTESRDLFDNIKLDLLNVLVSEDAEPEEEKNWN